MQNDKGEIVDIYLPRKCSATNQLIGSKDHASVQINVAKIDNKGRAIPGEFHTYAFCGAVRQQGEVDDSLNRLTQDDKITTKVF